MALERPEDSFQNLKEKYPDLFKVFGPEQLAEKGYQFTLEVLESEQAEGAEISDILEELFPGELMKRVEPLMGTEVWIKRSDETWQKALAVLPWNEARSVGVEWDNALVTGGKQSKRVPSVDVLRWQLEAKARGLQ